MTDITYNSSEILDEIRLFYPFYDGKPAIDIAHDINGNFFVFNVKIEDNTYKYQYLIKTKKDFSTSAKLSMYRALSAYTGICPPWGSLTGIRPTKLVYDYLQNKSSNLKDFSDDEQKEIIDFLSNKYYVSTKKSLIISDIINNQKQFYIKNNDFVNLYIHIPFCPTKCVYCSFVSLDARKFSSLIPVYVDALILEIQKTLEFILQQGYKVYSIYIGGGTPTVLDEKQLSRLLSAIKEKLPSDLEFTVEAGRPDTITYEKLDIMKEFGVNRISVNPQTFNNETLKNIGRLHSAEDVVEKYYLAKERGFVINADLIAGLPNETLEYFKLTIDKILQIKPHNVTVHTLARKNGSEYKLGKLDNNNYTEEMVDDAYVRLTQNGYLPYYLYRQKSMMGNLENIGYALPNFQCVNNITVMEETLSVVACGAGAINKRLFENNRIERLANLRDVKLYLEQFDARLKNKLDFFNRK